MHIVLGLTLSLAFHAGLWTALRQSSRQVNRREAVPIEFEVRDAKEALRQARPLVRRRERGRHKLKHPSLRDLSPQMALQKDPGQVSGGAGSVGSDVGIDTDVSGWGTGGGDFEQIEHYLSYQRLLDEIQGLLNYPSVLGRRGISGTVNVRLVFDQSSRCDPSRKKVFPGERHLSAYIHALIRKLCELETVEHIKLHGQTVDLSFRFALTETTDALIDQETQSGVVGNVITFSRYYPKSRLEWNVGPFRGIWFVPAVIVDPAWIYENWEKYVGGKDPLREFTGTSAGN